MGCYTAETGVSAYCRDHGRKRTIKNMKKKIYNFLFPAIALLCMAVAVLFPSFLFYCFIPLAVIASLFSAVSVSLNKSPILPLAAVFVFLIVLLYTKKASLSLLYMFLFLPVGVAVGVSYRRKNDLGQAVLIALLVSALMFLLMCVSYILEVSPIFSVRDALEPFRQMVSSVSDWIYSQISAYAATDTSNVFAPYLSMTRESFANTIFFQVVYSAPIVLGAIVMIVTALVYFVMKFLLRRMKNDVSFMTSFDLVRVTKGTAVLYMISTVLSVFLSFATQSVAFYLVVYILSSLLGIVLSFCGLSVVWAFLKTRDISGIVRIILFIFIIFVCLVITFLPSLLAFLGVLDTFTDIRSRFSGRFGI